MDRFTGMAVFAKVVDTSSFSGVTRHFDMSPATVSKYVQVLEERLGVRLLNRTTRHASRPVVLTALAAILGMIPLAQSIFWGPMAITIMGGLLVATVLTPLVVPALYAICFRVRRDEAVRSAIVAQTDAELEGDIEPIRIAAE